MNLMPRIDYGMRRLGMAVVLLVGLILMGCTSAPEPQPEPSKIEVQQDSDRFFEKMKKEEPASPYPE
jgi:hypothetical protein